MVVPLVIGIVAAGSGHARGGGNLIRNASLVLTMDPHRGDQSVLGQLEDADVRMVDDTITAVGVNLRKPSGTSLILSDFVVHSLRPPKEEAMSRLWSQLGWYSKPLRSWNGERRVGSLRRERAP